MLGTSKPYVVVLTVALISAGSWAAKIEDNPKGTPAKPEGPAVLWRDPADIASRNLYYGPGGKEHEPHGPFTFQKEDMKGTSPKFVVVDRDGVKWKVKLDVEAKPETVASRLVWAAGYFVNEDYFMPELHVQNLPRLHRGKRFTSKDGTVRNARLKRHLKDQMRIGAWSWSKNPFTDTREWYGLRVLMAVLNNWDLKDTNNSIYQVRGDRPEMRYVVSDLGATFGMTGLDWESKGNLKAYAQSKWIKGTSPASVDFNVPSPQAFTRFLDLRETIRRFSLVWIGQNIPLAHARWMGHLLAQLSPLQIRDAFRSAGYSPQEVEAFSRIVEQRIALLEKM